MTKSMKIVAFYLPQYHAIPENDEWWGKGFTEWENLKRATPLFAGHDQPKIPYNNNYYNLLDESVMQWQIGLAKEYGVYGFCFYHYWFNGKLLLEKPIEQFLNNSELDLPFCLCWANPPWTKAWVSKSEEILIDQKYGDEQDWGNHFEYLLPYLKDHRYITNSKGMPLLIIYDPHGIPNLERMFSHWRELAQSHGFPGIEFAYQYVVPKNEKSNYDRQFDYSIEFQPAHALRQTINSPIKRMVDTALRALDLRFYSIFNRKLSEFLFRRVRTYNYDKVWNIILDNQDNWDAKTIPCAFVDWDNTPRRSNAGKVLIGGSPSKFQTYLSKMIGIVAAHSNEGLMFLTAWNEWSEGCYLEPDQQWGFAYLEAVRDALNENNAFPQYP